ncbi:hypothetical protein GCM10010435_75110 [Winogradskya consettensis]|uniref:Uncharacterized protein n=1 Tax=Winogradskya consettensis TaxID=113560 RepID=A0A919T1B4_9ACTN|nr:hypothetical protein [Actinoplanes consettensis]GIM81104.1 hypothetical protein Aco04nite_74890 [Actinoplanes consettensis]
MTPGQTRDTVLRRIRLTETAIVTGYGFRTDQLINSAQLIELGLDALLAGVDTPSLAELAGLTRAEEPEATELFRRVADELGLAVSLPVTSEGRDRALLLLWAQLLLDGTLDTVDAAARLYWAISALGHPESLSDLLTAVVRYEDRVSSFDIMDADRTRDLAELAGHLVAEARTLLRAEDRGPG